MRSFRAFACIFVANLLAHYQDSP